MRTFALLAAFLLAVVSVAATVDPRGWSEGKPAAAAAQILAGPELTPVTLPKDLARRIAGPTLLFYFSPGCPHCVRVAPEIAALAKRTAGSLTVIGVAAGGTATPAVVEYFKITHGWTFEVVRDETRAIGAAMGAEGTPAALLVDKVGGAVVARDRWYPYAPGADVLVEMRLSKGDPFAAFQGRGYLGSRACASCHVHEAEAWLLSHHSVAWATLVKDDKHTDPECVACHVTGMGQPGGWDGNPESKLVDVGCEACHGAAGPHDGVPTAPEGTCAACHDAKHSIAFSYAKGLPLLDHFRSVAMSDAELVEARKSLIQGEVSRDLLAFADGERVGSAACASCHAAEHAQWAASPHAHAMATLVGAKAADQPACVSCHATARVGGPPPATLEGYRMDESVGCESCHGPGGAHVAAKGGKDNIVGLGESCPVCVIEAVCTRCHTSAWDPDWDLDRDLPRAGHRPHP